MAELVEALLQGRRLPLDGLDEVGDAAQLGAHAGGDDDGLPAAVGDHRAHVDHVETVAERQVGVGQRVEDLVDGLGFAGERGFLHAQVGALDEPAVGRHHVARLEQDDVARHEIARGHLDDLPAAPDADNRHREALEHRHRALGALFVHEAQDGVEDDDREDGDGVGEVAEGDDGSNTYARRCCNKAIVKVNATTRIK